MDNILVKNILVGISGGIAAYKSAELVRLFKKAGYEVRVCMTAGACEFITPLTLQALSGNPVHCALLDTEAEAGMGHIELARWADLVIIAPATADLMARLRAGMANDLLSTVVLATDAPVHIAPAMNQQMWAHPATQENVAVLQQRHKLHGPAAGEQACGDVGYGRMLEPQEIYDAVIRSFGDRKLSGHRLLITAGPTREPLDPVRYLPNRSSGKMGYAIAEAASAMAVSDYRLKSVSSTKMKKNKDSNVLQLDLVENPDVLATTSHANPDLFTVGFAAETNDVIKYASGKLIKKGLDLIVANQVGADKGFDVETNQVDILTADGNHHVLPEMNKSLLAYEILAIICQYYLATDTSDT